MCFPWFINSKNYFDCDRLRIWRFNVDRLFYSSHDFWSSSALILSSNQGVTDWPIHPCSDTSHRLEDPDVKYLRI